jgi:hypothetical protein
MAVTPADFLLRRTRLGLFRPELQLTDDQIPMPKPGGVGHWGFRQAGNAPRP